PGFPACSAAAAGIRYVSSADVTYRGRRSSWRASSSASSLWATASPCLPARPSHLARATRRWRSRPFAVRPRTGRSARGSPVPRRGPSRLRGVAARSLGELGWRRSGPGPAQVAVVDQPLDGQAVVGGLTTVEGPRCPVADLVAALLRQPAQVSGPAALAGVDPRRRRHDRSAVAGLEAQLAIWAAQDLVVAVMEPSMVGCTERKGIR